VNKQQTEVKVDVSTLLSTVLVSHLLVVKHGHATLPKELAQKLTELLVQLLIANGALGANGLLAARHVVEVLLLKVDHKTKPQWMVVSPALDLPPTPLDVTHNVVLLTAHTVAGAHGLLALFALSPIVIELELFG